MHFLRACGLAVAATLAAGLPARASHLYTLYNPKTTNQAFVTPFNNSFSNDAEDNFVANSFQAVAGGEVLTSISVTYGAPFRSFTGGPGLPPGTQVTAAIYTASSVTDPTAGGGLQRIDSSTTTVPLSATKQYFPTAFKPPFSNFPVYVQTIQLAQPVTLQPGQVFYAALLIRNVPDEVFPFFQLAQLGFGPYPPDAIVGQSFFDVGPQQSAPYDLDNTQNLTVLGGNHPVVFEVNSPGTLTLNVNSVSLPEPATVTLPALACACLALRRWRRAAA
jgi:hypothetical protein